MKQLPFGTADMMLPDFSVTDGEKWAVIACDQYTSEPAYWQEVADKVGDAPSTYRMILPELYLNDRREERVCEINQTMRDYLAKGIFKTYKNTLIYLERKCRSGVVRHGLVGQIDLDAYSYEPDAKSLIRATEGTVISRIPPRVEVRRDAELEMPHVMLLLDDAGGRVIEPLTDKKKDFQKAYSFSLMMGGGEVDAYFLSDAEIARVLSALQDLMAAGGDNPFLFAVGDGNHSLASAKAHYEALKKELGAEKAATHPARYALVELVNIHDAALEFEPIYRVVFGADKSILTELRAYADRCASDESCKENGAQSIHCVTKDGECDVLFAHGSHSLTVGSLQIFLDDYIRRHPSVEVDYIHGTDSLRSLAKEDGAVGFLFDGMEKSELFPSVAKDGPLPRKTFSMGEAWDKRYYLEARRIRAEG